MKYVIGIDLGTSAVKVLLVNEKGKVEKTVSKSYPIIQEHSGYSEQNPEDWVTQTKEALKELLQSFTGDKANIRGISYSGQMHGLVLLGENNKVLRNAILWNDTRTTEQCLHINDSIGESRILEITKNIAIEGFTLPKLLWVKENEPEIFKKTNKFLLPKDYVRYRMTGSVHIDYTDAAGTLMFDMKEQQWSEEICNTLGIDNQICPELVYSHEEINVLDNQFLKEIGLSDEVKIFAGGADNACGAIGANILNEQKTLCSIGTSGVILSYESELDKDYNGKVHYFNHGVSNMYYTMGVTLSAGYSLSWFKENISPELTMDELLEGIEEIKAGSKGLLFTPYLFGERTPHADAEIRGSFIGVDSSHTKKEFVKAIIEGITFSLNETVKMFRENGKNIKQVVSIGGGAKSDAWLQIQADIFNAEIIKLKNEQGPGIGAAMLAAYGSGLFDSLESCAEVFVQEDKKIIPNKNNVVLYENLFEIYKKIYDNTKEINEQLTKFK